jgi:hypothetical protein
MHPPPNLAYSQQICEGDPAAAPAFLARASRAELRAFL